MYSVSRFLWCKRLSVQSIMSGPFLGFRGGGSWDPFLCRCTVKAFSCTVQGRIHTSLSLAPSISRATSCYKLLLLHAVVLIMVMLGAVTMQLQENKVHLETYSENKTPAQKTSTITSLSCRATQQNRTHHPQNPKPRTLDLNHENLSTWQPHRDPTY